MEPLTRKQKKAAYFKHRYHTDPEFRRKQIASASNHRHKNPVERRLKKMVWAAKARAAATGLPFDLDWTDLEMPDCCPVLGIPLAKTFGPVSDNSPSLDKMIPAKGYVKGNVTIISQRANFLKANGTLEEFQKLTKWMEDNKPPSTQ